MTLAPQSAPGRVPAPGGAPRPWTAAAAAAGLGLALTFAALGTWMGGDAQAAPANLNLAVTGDDPTASVSADGKTLTLGRKGPLGSVFTFRHTVTVTNTGGTGGTGEIALVRAAGNSVPLAEALRVRVDEISPRSRTLIDSSLRAGGRAALNLPARGRTTMIVSFALTCPPTVAEGCPDVSGQTVTALLRLVQTAATPVPAATPAPTTTIVLSTPAPVSGPTTPPSQPGPDVDPPAEPSPTTSTPPLTSTTDDLVLSLGAGSLVPGGSASVSGENCPANSRVSFTVNGQLSGTTTAAADGTFTGSVRLQQSVAGRYPVVATCGDKQAVLPLDLVVPLFAGVGLASGAAVGIVLLFFILLGTLLFSGTSKGAGGRNSDDSLADEGQSAG